MDSEPKQENIYWDNLPLDPLISIFKCLDVVDLCSVGRVNTYWREIASLDEVWKRFCQDDWNISDKTAFRREGEYAPTSLNTSGSLSSHANNNSLSFKEIYKQHSVTWKRYKSCYPRIKRAWDRIVTWCQQHHPTLAETFQEGATEEELDDVEKVFGCSLHEEFRCLYRIVNGQNSAKTTRRLGLFGGYEFYEYHVNMQLCDLRRISTVGHAIKASRTFPANMKNHIPFIQAYNNAKNYFFVNSNENPHHTRGSIIELSSAFSATFLVASSISEIIEELADNLETGNYELTPKGEITRYPSVKNATEADTRNVIVKASPLFIAEKSSFGEENSDYFFAYRIRMTMKDDISPEYRCKLTTRHWYIQDGLGREEQVRGPGVIGFYPEVYPGSFFEYASCCPLNTRTGKMAGTFQMRSVNHPDQLFDAVVPEFQFAAPTPLEATRQ